jgi:hypothetical protein
MKVQQPSNLSAELPPTSLRQKPLFLPGVLVLIHDRDRFEAGSRWPGCLAVAGS